MPLAKPASSYRFNQEQILQWSEFSGDYNPLHYPPTNKPPTNKPPINKPATDKPDADANQVPTPSVPVQGMLSLLTVKPHLSHCLDADLSAGLLTVDTLLYQHVYTQNTYTLTVDSVSRQQGQYQLIDEQHNTCIKGNISATNAAMAEWVDQQDDQQLKVTATDLRDKYHLFSTYFPMSSRLEQLIWFFDCIAFRLVAHSDCFLNFDRYHFASLEDYLKASDTVQTGQRIEIATQTVRTLLPELAIFTDDTYEKPLNDEVMAKPSAPELTIDIHQPQFIETKPGEYLRVFHCRCRYAEQTIHTARTTLLSKMN